MATQLYEVAKTGDVPPGYVISVEVEGEGIAICNVDGEFFAIADECTHDGGSLDQGELEGDIIECPRHGAQFNVRTGAVVEPPAVESIGTYQVEVRGDTILVAVEPA
ncbi:MAG: non-heme iron oxygenase ferredoxin subunit [Chloroflexi bacterium]|nr:non-heme iron oxygenase ferredoxin subunit [Chloroflexota bacterium]